MRWSRHEHADAGIAALSGRARTSSGRPAGSTASSKTSARRAAESDPKTARIKGTGLPWIYRR
jgi:hypothetical protein